jgi:hypothetical protein
VTGVVVAGALAAKPGNGGEAWVRLSYVLGLQRLGFEVRFAERLADPSSTAVSYFREVTRRFGIAATLVGAGGEPIVGEPIESGDLLLDISGNLRAFRGQFRRTAFVDIDPGFTQFWHVQGVDRLPTYDTYFTIASNIRNPACPIPTGGIEWRPTLPPVVLDLWPVANGGFDRFTTVASWRCPYGPLEGYGPKHHAWRRFAGFPHDSELGFEAVLRIDPADEPDRLALEEGGRRIADPELVASPDDFQRYVATAGAEFSVAQGVYVDTQSAWFSDRSARYLASGKPVLVQDTGFRSSLPVGDGLLAFDGTEDAARAARSIVADYDRHSRAARAIAEEHFDSDRVLTEMLESAL